MSFYHLDFFDRFEIAELKEIQKSWSKYNINDIDLSKPPDFRKTVSDVTFLLKLIEELPNVYRKGYQDAEAGYENGFQDGLDEVDERLRKLVKKDNL